jgi:hypothetical protein
MPFHIGEPINMLFYMLDPGLLAIVSLTSFHVLADSPDEVDPYLGLRV